MIASENHSPILTGGHLVEQSSSLNQIKLPPLPTNKIIPCSWAMKVLGHSQLKTTQRSAHLSQETLLAAVDAAASTTGMI